MLNLKEIFAVGDAVVIKSPMVNHVHNNFCGCGEVVILLERDPDPNHNLDPSLGIKYDIKTTWFVWNKSRGHIKLTESWMQKI